MTKDAVLFKFYLDTLSKKERDQNGKLTLTEQEMDNIASFFAPEPEEPERSMLEDAWLGLKDICLGFKEFRPW